MTTYLPGAALLKQWLIDRGMSAHRFAIHHGLDGSELSKILRGKRGGVGVEFAVRVEDATEGAVPMRTWVPKKLENEHDDPH